MKAKKFMVLFPACVLALSGCGDYGSPKSVDAGSTKTIEIKISDTELCSLEIPIEFEVSESNNHTYWSFTDGTVIYLSANNDLSSSADLTNWEHGAEDMLYAPFGVIREFSGTDLVIVKTSRKRWCRDVMYQQLMQADVYEVSTVLPEDVELESLPVYDVDDEMELTDTNMYMPKGVKDSDLKTTGCVLSSGTDYIESNIVDGLYDEIIDSCVTTVIANSGVSSVDAWYYDGNTLYIEAGDNILAAKKLLDNEWYVYSGTSAYKDSMLTGVDRVRSTLK